LKNVAEYTIIFVRYKIIFSLHWVIKVIIKYSRVFPGFTPTHQWLYTVKNVMSDPYPKPGFLGCHYTAASGGLFLIKEQKINSEVFPARKGLISDNRIPSWSYHFSQQPKADRDAAYAKCQNTCILYIAHIKTYHFAS
jgi:hypothetical protein